MDLKSIVRLCSIVVVILIFILSSQMIQHDQKYRPFDSDINVELSTADTTTDKKLLIKQLNYIINKNSGSMYKQVVGKDNLEHERNIVWFGDKKPDSGNIILSGNNVDWLSDGLNGSLIHSNDMGDIPLSGDYSISKNVKSDLDIWANKNNIQLNYFKTARGIKRLYLNLIANPIGNLLISMYLLILTIFLMYFFLKAKERAIKLLSGVDKLKILKYDIIFLSKNMIIGAIVGMLVTSSYFFIKKGLGNFILIFKAATVGIVIIQIGIILCIIILSFVVEPKVKYIANREIPLNKFKYLANLLKLFAILFAVAVLVDTVSLATISRKMGNEYLSWSNIKDNFRLSFSTLDELYQESNISEVKNFISNMQNDGSMSISLAIDESIEMSNELRESGFDHIAFINKSWLNIIDVGIENQGKNGRLERYNFEDISPLLKTFLKKQLPLLIDENEIKTENLNYYVFRGEKMGILAPNTGDADALLTAKNPLIIVMENPAKELNIKGFIIPALSTGNIIFSDKNILDKNLDKNILKNYVISVDGIADLALKRAQDFREQFISYIIATITLFVSIVFTAMLGAKIWAYKNRKRIYIMNTNGLSFYEIIFGDLIKDLLLSIISIFGAGLLTLLIKKISINIVGIVIILIIPVFFLSILMAYRIFAKIEFTKVVQRA